MPGSIRSWVLKKPKESISIRVDMSILVPMRICYLGLRFLLRSIVGKERRDQSHFLKRFWFSELFSPSFHIARITNGILTKLRSSRRFFLVKISASQYGYSYYCRISDFAPGREDEIIQQFNPVEGDIVIDVGSNVGRYTILSSQLVGSKGKVIALEAHPATYDLLQRNLKLNNCNNVVALNCAAYSENKEGLRLFLPGADENGNTIYNTVMEHRSTTEDSVIVPAVTLDSIVQQYCNPDTGINWLKIDVEGAEFEVLKGAKGILARSHEIAILIEIHNLKHGSYYNEIMELLTKSNFEKVFEKVYGGGERHIILRKTNGTRTHKIRNS